MRKGATFVDPPTSCKMSTSVYLQISASIQLRISLPKFSNNQRGTSIRGRRDTQIDDRQTYSHHDFQQFQIHEYFQRSTINMARSPPMRVASDARRNSAESWRAKATASGRLSKENLEFGSSCFTS